MSESRKSRRGFDPLVHVRAFVVDATLVSVVKEVRRALDDSQSVSPIVRTAHRVGYAFAAPVDRVAPHSNVSRWLVVGSRRIALTGIEHVIGRDPASSIHVDAAGVSRRHAHILVRGHDAVLEDLGSKNGTTVNGRALEGSVTLEDEDQIGIGPVVVLFRCSASGESTETTVRSASPAVPRSAEAGHRCETVFSLSRLRHAPCSSPRRRAPLFLDPGERGSPQRRSSGVRYAVMSDNSVELPHRPRNTVFAHGSWPSVG